MALTEEQKQLMVQLYAEGNSIYAIAEVVGCAPQTVHKKLKLQGVRCRDRSGLTDDQKKQRLADKLAKQSIVDRRVQDRRLRRDARRQYIVQHYLAGESAGSISEQLGISTPAVVFYLRTSNIQLRSLSDACRVHELDERVFRVIDTEEKAYWLGFLTADAGISDQCDLRVNLQMRDKEQLEELQLFLQTTYPVREYHEIKPTYERHGYYLDWHSRRMVADLAQLGLGPRKSKTVRWSKGVPANLHNHYLRGIFDGDGTWSSMNKKGTAGWHLIGNRMFLLDVQPIMMDACTLRKTKLIDHHTTPEIAILSWTGSRQVMRIANWMYKDATVFLPRKFYRIYDYFRHHYPDETESYYVLHQIHCSE
jgi:DNA-directed RNA polymerase specialized sigma24 family protein